MEYKAPEFPKRIEIELVSDCNLKCTYCPRHHINELIGYMNIDLFKRVVDEASMYPDTILVLHRRGESMLHPNFNYMLNYVAGKFNEVQMATNATLLNQNKFDSIINGLDFISFSMDSPNNFDRTRIPAKYDSVEEKINRFLNYNDGRVKTQVSMVKTEYTPDEACEQFVDIWEEKVDRVRIYEEHSKNGEFGSLVHPRDIRKPCVMPIYEMLIYDNGSVGRCNHDWGGEGLGDVSKNSIKEIWMNSKYIDLREQHCSQKIIDPVCSKCDSWYPEIGNQGTGDVVTK